MPRREKGTRPDTRNDPPTPEMARGIGVSRKGKPYLLPSQYIILVDPWPVASWSWALFTTTGTGGVDKTARII